MEPLTSGHANPLPPSSLLNAHEVVHLPCTTSTMDEAHARADRGAPAGTLVVADEQTAGRGRSGNVWESQAGHGVWFTLLERPTDAAAVDVLSIRLGLAAAAAIDELAEGTVKVKWPNDLYVGSRKLGGILVEARWREGTIDWVAVGVGINLRVPSFNSGAAALRPGTTRNDVLTRLVPALRAAAERQGALSASEQGAWEARDVAINREISAPFPGVVRGLERNGALRVEDPMGFVHDVRSGSLVFAEGLANAEGGC